MCAIAGLPCHFSGDFERFNVKFLISQLLDQMQENQRYTKNMESYVAKLQDKLKRVSAGCKQQGTSLDVYARKIRLTN